MTDVCVKASVQVECVLQFSIL